MGVIITTTVQILTELDEAVLCSVPPGIPLSSKGIRRRQVSVGTMLVSALRRALQVSRVRGR